MAGSRPGFRPGLPLLAALLLAALAAPRAVHAGRPTFPASRRFVPGEFVITFEDGTRGLAAKTDGVQASVATSLAKEAAAVASLGLEAAADVLARPFTTAYVSPYEVDKKGRPIPGPITLVRINERLLDGASARPPAADAIADRIVQLMEQAPGVAHVSRHTLAQRLTVCGKSWSPAASCPGQECCRADTSLCSTTAESCTDFCQPFWGTCTDSESYTPLPRVNVLNSRNPFLGGNLPGHEITEATMKDASGNLKAPFLDPNAANGRFTVMVLDSGVGPHRALNVVGCRNFFPDPTINHDGITECQDDADSHGTHVAGIVGARNRGSGMWGVLPDVRIWAARSTNPADLSELSVLGFYEALGNIIDNSNPDNVAVINMSWADGTQTPANRLNFCERIQALRKLYGIIFVTAAGNEAEEASYELLPNRCDGVIIATAVSRSCTTKTSNTANGRAVTRKCTPWSSSNWVSTTRPQAVAASRMARTVMAPGSFIYSTTRNNKYGWKWGTSMASPHIAGIAARCFAAGDCKLGDGSDPEGTWGDDNLAKLTGAFNKRNTDPSWRWDDAATNGDFSLLKDGTRQYYGPMAWAGHW